jgi:SAM-dependent methyltransferase
MSSWSPVWDQIFRSNRSWNRYPPEELVRFFAKHYCGVPKRSDVRVLDIGCGPAGGPSRYAAREGFSYFGIDGSVAAIERANEVFATEKLVGSFGVAPLEQLPFEANSFDCVIDICCLQHNSEANAARAIAEVERVLKPGGRHFSLTAKDRSWGDGTGVQVDSTSYKDVTEGPYMGMDTVRFATLESLRNIYSRFSEADFEYSIRSVDDRKHEIGHWQVSVLKAP